MSDSIVVGTGYAINMYEVYVYPSDGVNQLASLGQVVIQKTIMMSLLYMTVLVMMQLVLTI